MQRGRKAKLQMLQKLHKSFTIIQKEVIFFNSYL